MATTFAVDRVDPVLTLLPKRGLTEAATALINSTPLSVSHTAELIAEPVPWNGLPHPLLTAVHQAFAQHRPLALSPDHIWLTIEQGFAIHVVSNSEQLRQRFVRHDGRAPIRIEVDRVPDQPAEWSEVIAAFGHGIAEHVGPGIHRLLSANFSTTTNIERTASEVVMMSAFQRYFDYLLVCICGIPAITLEGTIQDWTELRRRIDVLAEYDLGAAPSQRHFGTASVAVR